MRVEDGASASAVAQQAGHTSAPAHGYSRFNNNEASAGIPAMASLRAHISWRPNSSSDADQHIGFDDTLPPNDFLKDLHREKRRAERSRTALSIVVYQVADQAAHELPDVDHLLEVLHSAKRETDIVGHVGGTLIAVLCPDTDADGCRGFMRKISERAGIALPQTVSATYPDVLFDNLARGIPAPSTLKPLLFSDRPSPTRQPYPLKRSLDIIAALLAIGLLWPLMLATALAIAMTSRGPVIFKQTRLGKGGVPFSFYKFRSMMANVDDLIHRDFVADIIGGVKPGGSPQASAHTPYKLVSDPRITPVGRLLRKTSIDELPQLFNVLKGDMSLIGPRPPIPYEAAQYLPWHLRRVLNVKPGMTGLWQVEGRSRVPFNDMVRMDLRYIRDCSLSLDLKILLKTVLVVFRCDGAA